MLWSNSSFDERNYKSQIIEKKWRFVTFRLWQCLFSSADIYLLESVSEKCSQLHFQNQLFLRSRVWVPWQWQTGWFLKKKAKVDKPSASDNQANKPTNRQTDKQTNRQSDKQTNRQTDKQTKFLKTESTLFLSGSSTDTRGSWPIVMCEDTAMLIFA